MNLDRRFCGRNVFSLGNVLLDGKPIEKVTVFKYLGVLIDSDLKFEKQMEKNLKSAIINCTC